MRGRGGGSVEAPTRCRVKGSVGVGRGVRRWKGVEVIQIPSGHPNPKFNHNYRVKGFLWFPF